ncbi:surfactin synthetase subunit 3 [Xylariomycetidae sp. FL2044]|nr:surfactin synthetase subunit 3 [Xylariomycetidae sp. FL2044]
MSFHSIDNLSFGDQMLFNKFGRGPSAEIPFGLVHQAFESVADRYPHATAVRHHDGTDITYHELERRSNVLSNRLIQAGLQPGDRVCLVSRRSIEMITGILAVLKAGAQYVPLDGGIVAEASLSHIFQDTKARFVLCMRKFRDKVERHIGIGELKTTEVIELDQRSGGMWIGDEARPDLRLSPELGAYLIYTSGTTGNPKGVDVRHRNVTNNLLVEPASLKITVGTKVAQLLNIQFDMAAWEILATLMNGGTLYTRGSDWHDTLRRVDTVISTPTVLGRFAQADFPNVKTIVVGGEPCPVALAEEWSVADNHFWNICGPTEITILNTAHLHKPGAPLTIGKPLPNTNVYVLDDDESPVGIGKQGVMWVGGACVSGGYINLPDLTALRFKMDKFTRDGAMMFNTGDLCRWTKDGNLEPLGRQDEQVKIKGFRVELDGVSAAIERTPLVIKACALLVGDDLCGIYSAPSRLSELQLKSVVGSILPYYAVPTRWIFIRSIPRTANGKFDKRKLKALVERGADKLPGSVSLDSDSTTLTNVSSSSSSSSSSTSSIATSCPPPPSSSSLSSDESREGDLDLEKGLDMSKGEVNVYCSSEEAPADGPKVKYDLPAKNGFHGQRWLRHRFFSLYRRFFSVAFLANLIALVIISWQSWDRGTMPIPSLSTAVASNLLVAVAMRQDHVINFLFWLATRVPTRMPISIRRQCARVYHIGGIHSGAAISATMWWLVFTASATNNYCGGNPEFTINLGTVVLSYLVLFLLTAIVGMAHPDVRVKLHDQFEWTHRFAGWIATALVWAHLIVATDSLRPDDVSLAASLAKSPAVYLLALITLSIALPWLRLRRVTVRPEPLSKHAIRLHFDFDTPIAGKAIRISDNPMREWHAFATIDKPGQTGFSVIVSNAGDWTKKTIDRAPRQLWTRGVLCSGVLAIAPLFKKIVLVATGSGIGPCLPVILEGKVPARILWSTPHPRETFGQEILDNVLQADPKAIIWNTRTRGKPDLAAMSYQMMMESQAEAVCIISNKKVTEQLVYRLEARGIPAFGAIFDS